MSRLLAIDIGNTQTTLGLFEGEKLVDTWRLSTKVARTGDELWILLSHLIELNGKLGTLPVSISSVVPELTHAYVEMVKARLRVSPLVIGAETVKSLSIAYTP